MNLRNALITIILLLVASIAVAAYWRRVQHVHQQESAAITSQAGQSRIYSGGRGVEIIIGGNPHDETKVVLILHKSQEDPRVHQDRYSFSSATLTAGVLSSYKFQTHYPPDPKLSGLWIDGQQRDLSGGLTVVYISDVVPATDIVIPQEEQAAFIREASYTQALPFVEKWILPRLPGA